MDKAKVALLVSAPNQPGWIHEVADWLRRDDLYEVSALLVAEADDGPRGRAQPWSSVGLGPVARLENRILNTRHRAQLAPRALAESVPAGIPLLRLTLRRDERGDLVACEDEAFAAMRGLGLDLILILGLPAVRGAFTDVARRGAWLLAHSELEGQADVTHAGFWEVYQRADHTTVKLWRVGAVEQGDVLLDARSFNTEPFWLKNRARALSLGNFMLFDTLRAAPKTSSPTAHPAPIAKDAGIQGIDARRRPAQWDGAAYLARQAWMISGLVLRKAMKRNVTWRIAMCPSAHEPMAALAASVLEPPKGRFFADPFVYTHEGRPYVFFEDYDFRERKGKISVASYADGAFRFLGTVLDLPYHLSFPFIFHYNGATYMVPETCGNRTIELWRCTEFPLKWEIHEVLMSNVSAVDTIVFFHGKYWWLFTNIDRADGTSHCDELFAFYADRPDATTWTPHALNPIIRSPVKARNAGMVVDGNGDVIRCAQTQGFLHYGKGVSLNRIEELSPSTYSEAEGQVHYPSFLRKPFASMHHWHHHGGHTVFDFAFME
ncbi:glucosamine inositolphosphorylceramide transferase family protein [Achromobacter aloeverae]|uniref:Glucosamine inositolphosphorylceramide transferase 1 N-terminal domain-containing protein n=1 Tax=Achromobacter aloeverae TaxID=1750518 RepID=A0A4Q1HSH6_9BURK|nr:hypothetical protein [Achromobacter aloeverae]RXN93266.1 hypothetical protein C7R54_06090 [Achromobacter aloeverae]